MTHDESKLPRWAQERLAELRQQATDRALFEKTFAALKTAEADLKSLHAACTEEQRKRKAAELEVHGQRALVRAACEAKDGAVFRLELYQTPAGEFGITVASSAGKDLEMTQARIAAAVLSSLFVETGEPEDQHIADEEPAKPSSARKAKQELRELLLGDDA